jgi:uncharacterized protein YukE
MKPSKVPGPDYKGYAEEAKKTVEKALKSQQELIASMTGRGEEFRELGEASQSELASLYGRTGGEAIQRYESQFNRDIPMITETYRQALNKFDPNLLTSPSAGRFKDYLRGAVDEYRQALRGEGEVASGRLYKTLEAPQKGFGAVAVDPAFNIMYDPKFMELAKRPPTVRSDVDSMANLYSYSPGAAFKIPTYNV